MLKKNIFILSLLFFSLFLAPLYAAEETGTVAWDVKLDPNDTPNATKLWLPYPVSNESQTISKVKIEGNYLDSGVYHDPASDTNYLYFSNFPTNQEAQVKLSYHVDSHYKKNETLKELAEEKTLLMDPRFGEKYVYPPEVAKYLKASKSIPSDDAQIKEIAQKIILNKTTTLEKAQAVYDWTIENTHRDPTVNGCGIGDPLRTLNSAQGGGKCADISAVFVTIARAAGIPARDIYGLRLAEPKSGEITGDFHCWAEFYLPGTGWVLVDPADVRKMMLVQNIELKDAAKWKQFFWGGDSLFRLALNTNTRDIVFAPEQKGEALNYFMYPYAEVNGLSVVPKYKVTLTLDK